MVGEALAWAVGMIKAFILPANGMPFSCAALIDREGIWAVSRLQKRPDLAAAKRRQLQRRVRPLATLKAIVLCLVIGCESVPFIATKLSESE